MSLKTVSLCIVCVVICMINCAANPIGKPEPFTRDEKNQHTSKDVFMDVAKILSDANHEAKKSSPDSNRSNSEMPTIKLRHPKHNRRNSFARGPRDQDMLKDAPNRVQGDRVRKRKSSKPHDWRPEWDSPQLASYNAYPYQPYEYISHPYYNYHYSGYDNWYSNQIPNYHSYNVPPEHEWKTTVHEGPDVEWTAHIAFPDMEPIIITNKNYTSSKSNVQVVINKSEPKNGRNNARHVPVPGPRNVDPNAISSTRYSYSPSITPAVNGNKNIKHSFEPITWTATVDYPHSAPIIMKGVIPQVQGPVHYVKPPGPQIAGQGYYYPYNAAPVQWPAPAYNNIPWMSGYGGYPVLTNPPPTYPVLTNPPPVYQWPGVSVSYPSTYPPYSPPHGGKPPLKSDDDGDDDEDDEDDDNGDDENGNDDKDNGDDGDGDDNGDVKDEDEVSDPMKEEDSNEDEAKVPDSEEDNGNGDQTSESKDDVKETEPKKGFFSWA